MLRLVSTTLSLCFLNVFAQGPVFVNPNAGEFNDVGVNSARRQIQGVINVTSSTIQLQVFAPTRPVAIQEFVDNNDLADILVTPTNITMTKAQILADGGLSGTFIVIAKPNPTVIGGYSVALELLLQRLNTFPFQPTYFKQQAANLLGDITNLVRFDFLHNGTLVKQWLRLPMGLVISNSWSTDQIIEVTDSFGSTTHTSFAVTVKLLPVNVLLTSGTYFFNLFAIMNPFPVANATDNTTTLITTQIAAINHYISDINGYLTDVNLLHKLTTAEIAQLNINKTFLENMRADVIAALP